MSDLLDLVVIGAGINGAGVAQAAAARGYSVLVLEQFDEAACGTSSRSSKLIHGGLRYLEFGQFNLVKECLHERKLLLKNAPGLVKLVPFYIPVYETTTRKPAMIRAGLSIYSVLGGLRKNTLFKKIQRSQWSELDGLNTSGLRAVYRYFDGQTNDSDLTKAVLRSAVNLGRCRIQYGAVVTRIDLLEDGVHLVYDDGQRQSCNAKVAVNAAGPWVNIVLDKVSEPLPRFSIDLVQGSHILLTGKLLKGIYYLESPLDRRVVFVMPWKGNTLVGATETKFSGDPADAAPTESEIEYLLETVKYYFPNNRIEDRRQILSSFAGVRVLPKGSGLPFARSRETVLIPDRKDSIRLLSVFGGKLTTYRATGEKVLKKIGASLPPPKKMIDTASLSLSAE